MEQFALLSSSTNSQPYNSTNYESIQLPTVACCICGISMLSNASNTCPTCLSTEYDITSNILKQNILFRCKSCKRFQKDTTGWLECDLESKELLTLCLRRIKGLKQRTKLHDAAFIWTEPHSKRVKVNVTVEEEVINGVTLRQSCVVVFSMHNKMCENCHQSNTEAKTAWNTVVQVRQKVKHKKTFLYLEQLILKHNQHEKTVKIDAQAYGLDFYFGEKNHAVSFVDFLDSVVPLSKKYSKKLVSSDAKSNTVIFHNTIYVDIFPVCKNDFVILPKALAKKSGNISRFVICTNVSSLLKFMDPFTLNTCEINTLNYGKYPFEPVCDCYNLTEYIVLDVLPVNDSLMSASSTNFGRRNRSRKRKSEKAFSNEDVVTVVKASHHKYKLVEVEIARVSDLGVNNERTFVLTHLGNFLKVGDSVLGYDLSRINVNLKHDDDLSDDAADLPDVILVRKHFPKWRKKSRKRHWKLRKLNINADEVEKADNNHEEMFLREVEEDEEVQQNINIYKMDVDNEGYSSEIEDDAPVVKLENLLNDLDISHEG